MAGSDSIHMTESHHQSKWLARLLYALGLFSILAIIAVTYRVGKDNAGVDWKRAVVEHQKLSVQHAEAIEEINRLSSLLEFEKAKSDREIQINKQAFEDISQTLQATSHEMAELKEDLRFYESVIQAESEGQGL